MRLNDVVQRLTRKIGVGLILSVSKPVRRQRPSACTRISGRSTVARPAHSTNCFLLSGRAAGKKAVQVVWSEESKARPRIRSGAENDYALDAAFIAKAMPGRPIKAIWTRQDGKPSVFASSRSTDVFATASRNAERPLRFRIFSMTPSVGH